MTKIYFGRPETLGRPIEGLHDASAVLDMLSAVFVGATDLNNFADNENNRSINGLIIFLDSTRHAIETAAAELESADGLPGDADRESRAYLRGLQDGKRAGFTVARPGPGKTLGELIANTPGADEAATDETADGPAEPRLTEPAEPASVTKVVTEENPKPAGRKRAGKGGKS